MKQVIPKKVHVRWVDHTGNANRDEIEVCDQVKAVVQTAVDAGAEIGDLLVVPVQPASDPPAFLVVWATREDKEP